MPENTTRDTRHATQVPLAWCGWETRIPSDWRPLDIQGEWERGQMMVGDVAQAVFQVKWWRPKGRRFDPQAWIGDRVKKWSVEAVTKGPRPKTFSATAFLADVPSKGGGSRAIWYGCSSAGDLVLEVAVNKGVDARTQRTALRKVLPAFRAAAPDSETKWAIYDVGFIAPRGYRIRDWKLYSGDITLRFVNSGDKSTLVLRQVYPAATALERRELNRWLRRFPFKEHRRYRPAAPNDPWCVELGARRWQGVKRRGRKQLAFPLNWVGRRHSVAGGVTDPELDRLLLVECDTKSGNGESVARAAIRHMNWGRYGD